MAQWLRAATALAEVLVLFPGSTWKLTVGCNFSPRHLIPSLLASVGIRHIDGAHTHMQETHPHTYNK